MPKRSKIKFSRKSRSSSRNKKKSLKKKVNVKKVGGARTRTKKKNTLPKKGKKKMRKTTRTQKKTEEEEDPCEGYITLNNIIEQIGVIPPLYRCLSMSKPNGNGNFNVKYAELVNKIINGTFSNINSEGKYFDNYQQLHNWVSKGSTHKNYGPFISTATDKDELFRHSFCGGKNKDNFYMIVGINLNGLNVEYFKRTIDEEGDPEEKKKLIQKLIFCQSNPLLVERETRKGSMIYLDYIQPPKYDKNGKAKDTQHSNEIQTTKKTLVFDICDLQPEITVAEGQVRMTSGQKHGVMSGINRALTASGNVHEIVLVSNEIGLDRVYVGENTLGLSNDYTIPLSHPNVKVALIKHLRDEVKFNAQLHEFITQLDDLLKVQTGKKYDKILLEMMPQPLVAAATNGYDAATSGYDAATSGYDAATTGYDAETSGYDAATSGMMQQPVYMMQKPVE